MSLSTGILCDWLNNLDKRYSPIRVFPQQLSNRQIGSSSNIKLRVQEGLNELGIVLLCVLFFLFLFCTFVQSLTNKKICLCILFKKNTDFFCLYFVISTFVYNVKFSYWSMTVQLYKTKIKK